MARQSRIVHKPSDGIATVVRQLSWLQLRASRQISQQTSARNLVAMGGAEFARAWREMSDAKKPEPTAEDRALVERVAVEGAAAVLAEPTPAPATDLLDGHDLLTVLVGGLPDYTKEQIEDLDERDAEFLGREILSMSPRPRTEDEEKNGASRFTDA